jgi:hypothetical protein
LQLYDIDTEHLLGLLGDALDQDVEPKVTARPSYIVAQPEGWKEVYLPYENMSPLQITIYACSTNPLELKSLFVLGMRFLPNEHRVGD